MSRNRTGPYSWKFSAAGNVFVVSGPGSSGAAFAPAFRNEAVILTAHMNAAFAAGAAAVPDLVAVCEAFVACFDANGEFNTHTAEHSPAQLREMAKAAIAAAKRGGV